MIDNQKLEPELYFYEKEPDNDGGGGIETLVLVAAIVLTYATGYANGVKEITSFLAFAGLGLLAWGWLLNAAIPNDDDNGL